MRQEVEAFCSRIGRSSLLVQGAGGNVSWKDGNVLWVKASGTWLADAQQQDIFVGVDLAEMRHALTGIGDQDLVPKAIGSTLRPSIETLMHALMPHTVVVHIHAIGPLACLVREDWERELAVRVPKFIAWGRVPYRKPGSPLAKGIQDVFAAAPGSEVLFLQNHGIVVGAPDVVSAARLVEAVVAAFDFPILPSAPAIGEITLKEACNQSRALQDYTLIGDPELHNLAVNPAFCRRLERDWALYPDHVVFLGANPILVDSLSQFESRANHEQASPELVFVRDHGVIVSSKFSQAKLAQLRCYYDVIVRQQPDQTLRSLTHADIGDLLNWDAEHYRQSLLK